MIRHAFINDQVLRIFSMLPSITFPLDIQNIIKYFPECRYMSYEKFAELNGCTMDEVIQLCESKSGCTHYDVLQDRYLILCNQSEANSNTGRRRWTAGHELGHVVCKHHAISAYTKLSENNIIQHTNQEFESEADYFAATLLAPFPLFNLLGIKSPIDIQTTFGLSCEASIYRFKQYLKWKQVKRKTAWENDLIHICQQKTNSYHRNLASRA